MLLRGPSETEFVRIFERACAARGLTLPYGMLDRFLTKHYRTTGKVFRRCHPRDVISHAFNLIHFEKLPLALTDEILDRAFHSCFLEDNDAEVVVDTPMLPTSSSPAPVPAAAPENSGACADYWTEKLSPSLTAFGALLLLGSARDATSGQYRDQESERQFGADETNRVLEEIHRQRFAQWRRSARDRQSRDLKKYQELSKLTLDSMKTRIEEWAGVAMPPRSGSAARCLLAHDLAMLVEMLAPKDAETVMLPESVGTSS